MTRIPTVFDLETKNIAPGRAAPPPICGVLATQENYDNPVTTDWPRLSPLLRKVIKSDLTYLINQNIFFDLAVVANEHPDLLPDIFRMFDEDRVYDTQVAQQLLAIAMGDKKQLVFGLDKLAKKWLGKTLTGKHGDDIWRTKYHELEGVPFEDYPEEAARYVADDRIALSVAEAQKAYVRRASGGEVDVLPTFYDQMRAAWAFYLMGAWGVQVDPTFLAPLAEQLEVHVSAVVEELKKVGIYRENGTQNTKEIKRRVAEDYGQTQPFPRDMEPLSPADLWTILKQDARRFLLHKNCMPLSKNAIAALEGGTWFLTKEEQAAAVREIVARGEPKPRAGVYYVLKPEELEGLRWPFRIRYPHEVPFTLKDDEPLNVKTDTETLLESDDEYLRLRGEVSGDKKLLETYVPLLRAGTRLPINPRWNVLVDSGRSSCGKPNLQNQPRQPGVRECFVPHEGCVFIACDYSVAELRSLAQVLLRLFGTSAMADAVKEGKDLHLVFVAMLLGVPYDEVYKRHKAKDPLVKKMRNLAKAMNFGVPGGLGAEKFVKFAKASYGIHIAEYAPEEYWTVPKPEDRWANDKDNYADLETATLVDIGMRYFKEVLKPLWLNTYPEMDQYFKYIGSLTVGEDPVAVTHTITGYVRGGVYYCAACNQNFQHLTAMGAKKALYEVVRECYVDCGTDLFGCRPVAFIHDEILIEAPEWLAERAAKRLATVMAECMKGYTPDLPADTDSAIMRRWRKSAEGPGIWEDRDLTEKEIQAIVKADSVWAACVKGGVEPERAEKIRREHAA